MNLKDFRGDVPLGDEDFLAIRRNVMQQIAAPRSNWLGVFLRASFAVALMVFFVTRVVERPAPLAEIPKRTPIVIAEKHKPEKPKRAHHRKPKKEPVQIAAAPVRIELHTSNPDIRILWITNPESGETR